MILHSAHATHTGLVRDNNEDAFLDDSLFAVADGIGGYPAGEVASALAIEALKNGLARTPFDMDRTFRTANARILAAAKNRPGYAGMGTTMTALAIHGGHAIVGHVGDCRLVRVRNGHDRIERVQLTRDHTVAAEIERTTLAKADPAWKSVLGNCLGHRPGSHGFTDVFEVDVRHGDAFVLATDGLGDYFDAGAIGSICAGAKDPQAIADALVRRAIEAGGRDNVTVVIVEVG